MNLEYRYNAALRNIPPPGGNGCHVALLGAANLGVLLGLGDAQIIKDIQSSIPKGTRSVPQKEIVDTVKRSRRDTSPMPESRRNRLLDAIIAQGRGRTVDDLRTASPITIDCEPQEDWLMLLGHLYRDDDMLFCGDRHDTQVWKVADLIDAGEAIGPHIIPNPMTGQLGKTKDDKDSYRADACVKDFRFAVVEFDNLSHEDQCAFWWAIRLNVVALVDSGGKSIHGWVRVCCNNSNEWTERVERSLYAKHLIPLGVDSSCKNEARLSRTPGWKRDDKWQRLLYLCPEGRPVHKGSHERSSLPF